jgi:hypothetical protein
MRLLCHIAPTLLLTAVLVGCNYSVEQADQAAAATVVQTTEKTEPQPTTKPIATSEPTTMPTQPDIPTQPAFDPADYLWENRLLSEAVGKQEHRFAEEKSALEERHLKIFRWFSDAESGVGGDAEEGERLRGKYNIGASEEVLLLIGKDGGEKFRGQLPVQLGNIFALIDTMPMRRQEMRKQQRQ